MKKSVGTVLFDHFFTQKFCSIRNKKYFANEKGIGRNDHGEPSPLILTKKNACMSKINLKTEPCFKELMKQIGFKKTKGKFVRNEEETIWGLSFGHGSYGQRQVRYYDCLYSDDYPQITEAAKQLGEYVYGHYGQIGYLMPEKRFVEWRLADSDTEEYYLNMINLCFGSTMRS